MSFLRAIASVLGKYAVFSGRACRAEYWYWTFALFIGVLLCQFSDAGLNQSQTDLLASTQDSGFNLGSLLGMPKGLGPATMLFVLVTFLPSLAVSVRRMHDVGKSGWWVSTALIPLVGSTGQFFFYIRRGQLGENAYGPSPLKSLAERYAQDMASLDEGENGEAFEKPLVLPDFAPSVRAKREKERKEAARTKAAQKPAFGRRGVVR